MSSHDRFRELSALATIDQLTPGEKLELTKHLRECEICQEVHDDYLHIVQHQLPQGDAIPLHMKMEAKLFPNVELWDRIVARGRAEGLYFSTDVESDNHPRGPSHSFPKWTWLWRPALTLGVLATAMFLVTLPLNRQQRVLPSGNSDALAKRIQENQELHAQLTASRQTEELESAELIRLRKENSLSAQSLSKLESQLHEAQETVETLSAEIEAANSKSAGLAGVDRQQGTVIADLQAQIDKLERQRADYLSDLVSQEARIRDLNRSLQEATINFEREQQLMAASADVRRLMGARNLHIIDVHDVNGNSRSAKAFGRVLYAEGQSLIFYAFDLVNSPQSPAKYTFQAWGQRELETRSPRNLGTFQVDDHEQRRWVLKVNNPALLKGIDSVFVTAESLSDAKEPRGRKLLYAYIVGQPNHP
jgi:hypothetical protein